MLRLFLLTLLPAPLAIGAEVQVSHAPGVLQVSNGEISIGIDSADGSLKFIRQCSDREHCRDLGVTAIKAAYEEHGDDFANDPQKAMYWDANASVHPLPPGATAPVKGYFRPQDGEPEISVITQTPERADVRVRIKPTPLFPLQVDYHYVLLQGQHGYYVYAVVHHSAQAPAVTFYQHRFVIKTVMDGSFTQWALGPHDFIDLPDSQVVQKLSDATFKLADGRIKTKYMNSIYWSQTPLYGYVGPHQGLWMLEASPEYHNGGPAKQGQAVHDNTMLRVLQSVHFGASAVELAAGEVWSKVYGPFMIYANRADGPAALWADAERQLQEQRVLWPYRWVDDPAYRHRRVSVSGHVELGSSPAANAWVILSDPGVPWSAQTKGYAFWTRTDSHGDYRLAHVIPGNYQLSVSGADQPHDMVRPDVDIPDSGTTLQLPDIHWTPEDHGRTLWQIGRFDRSAAEFHDGDDARQFQMYTRYPAAFPKDVDYHVGQSTPRRDWNYAQWSIYSQHPEWRIEFELPQRPAGTATLTLGFASAQPAHGKLTDLRVRINGTEVAAIHLPKTGTAGYRGGVQDSPYHVQDIRFPASLLLAGHNLITLAHADAVSFASFQQANAGKGEHTPSPGQVMYDALRLQIDP
ncbi:polysaccharide lyase family protein [Frateuria aurantia]